MGNTATSTGKTRAISIEQQSSDRESSSPKTDDDAMKNFDFNQPPTSKKKPLICYSSVDYASDENNDEFKGRARATTIITPGTTLDENALPTVFKWEGGGKEVFITGTFSDWKPIKMCSSHGDFVAIVDIPEGKHEYKYIVDGSETLNMNVQKDESSNNNVIHVRKSDFEVFEALAMDLASNTTNNTNNSSMLSGSPPGEYSQNFPPSVQLHQRQRTESGGSSTSTTSGSGPPILPPHLLQVILNNPSVNSGDSTLLPQPNHVMLNHLYALSIKDGVMVLSCTHRYRKKYVTTLLYKPI